MRTEELKSTPNLTAMLAKAVLTAPTRRGGDLPDTELVLADVVADPDRLATYSRVCGFRLAAHLPLTYPHILGFPLALHLMTTSTFPFPLPGLVHSGNRITQHLPIPTDEPLTFRVHAGGLTATERGLQFEVRTGAHAGGAVVWEEESRYLRMSPSKPTPDTPRHAGTSEPSPASEPGVTPTAVWRAGPDIGRRYAKVSGDRNPIHLHPIAARLAGFRRPIAHGMWTLARCVAALEGRLPDACRVDVRFRRPITLPSTVGFATRRDGDNWNVAVHDREGVKTYLSGSAVAW